MLVFPTSPSPIIKHFANTSQCFMQKPRLCIEKTVKRRKGLALSNRLEEAQALLYSADI